MSGPKHHSLSLCIASLLRSGYVLGGLTLLAPLAVQANCNNQTPATGQTTTCDAAAPNPETAGVIAVAGSTGVTVNVLAGASLVIGSGGGIEVRDQSQVTNNGSISLTAANTFDAIFAQGSGNTVINNGSITTAGGFSEGIQTNGSNNALTNGAAGTISTSGANASGILSVGGSGNTLVNAGSITTSGATAAGVRIAGGSGNRLTNSGTIRATGAGSVGVLSTSVVTVTNAAGGSIFSQTSSGIALQAGGTVTNNGAVTAQAGTGIVFGGTAGSVLTNRGTISGTTAGVTFGAGNDRLDMLGGAIEGAVDQGDGDDSLMLSAGTMASLNQGGGADQMTISGGTIAGEVQQASGADDFVMTGGQIGSLLQGDNLDTFTMSDGRIVGAFEDGDSARMSGGRIGRVNMKLDDNLFDMSGGTIDGNLVAGFGNDTIILSDGYIGGNISVSGGTDKVTVTGGVVRGSVLLSFGNDSFTWDGGGIIYGPIDLAGDNDTAVLRNLHPGNLGATPAIGGGAGGDSISFDNVVTAGISRFTGWETANVGNASQLTFDGNLSLGDATTGTGVLNVDASSTLFGGGGTSGVVPTGAGQLVQVNNSGRIDLTNSSAADSFNIVGNYGGNNAALFLDTVLGGDGSASDKLVISSGTASGSTGLAITNAGGSGAETLQDGIMVVEAVNGGSTASGAFALYAPVAVGAFEYFLFKGGVSDGSSDNWYLRSTLVTATDGGLTEPAPAPDPVTPSEVPEPTPEAPEIPPPPPLPPPPGPEVPDPPPPVPPTPPPPRPPDPPPPLPPVQPEPLPEVPATPAPIPTPLTPEPPTPGATRRTGAVVPLYRIEAPTYGVVPPVLHELGLATMGTFHERQGEQALLQGKGALPAGWGRIIGQDTRQSWSGTVDPTFDGTLWGVQIGADLFARESDSGHRDHVGLFIGRTRMDGDVRGFALGWDNLTVGNVDLDDDHVGLYWTHVAPGGAYLDGVVLGSRYDGESISDRGIGVKLDGDGLMFSLEGGYPFALSENWTLEPQAQVIWQKTSLDDQRDRFSTIAFDAEDAVTARVGARLIGNNATSRLQPYIKANYWHGFGGTDSVMFGSNLVSSEQRYNAFEFGVGLIARASDKVSFYLVGDYTIDTGDEERKSFEGNLGMRVTW